MEMVDDEFWLKYAKDKILATDNSVTTAATQTDTLINWFWGVYTTAFAAGIITKQIVVPFWVNIILVLPIVLLMITKWVCHNTTMPVIGDFDPRVPSQIRDSFNSGTSERYRRFGYCKWWTLGSAFSVALALTFFSIFNMKPQEKKGANNLVLSAKLFKDGISGKKFVASSINYGKEKNIFLQCISYTKKGNDTLNYLLPTDTTGFGSYIFCLKNDTVEKCRVSATYNDTANANRMQLVEIK